MSRITGSTKTPWNRKILQVDSDTKATSVLEKSTTVTVWYLNSYSENYNSTNFTLRTRG